MSAGILLITKFWRHNAHFVYVLHVMAEEDNKTSKTGQIDWSDAKSEQLIDYLHDHECLWSLEHFYRSLQR